MWSLINDLGVNWVFSYGDPTQWQATNAMQFFIDIQTFYLYSTIRPVPKITQNWLKEIYNKNKVTRMKQSYEISTMNKRNYFTIKPIMFKPIKNARNKECFSTCNYSQLNNLLESKVLEKVTSSKVNIVKSV